MTDWTKQKLGAIVTFKTGKLNSNAAVINGNYPFFTCAQEIYKTNTYSFDTECVLLGGNNASAVYPIFYFDGKFDAYQRTYVIEPKDKRILNTKFIYYTLRQKLGQLKDQSTGATTKFLTLKILENLDINIPNIDIQQSIVYILATYDDLIEKNEKRINILEEMAQRLYTEWFVKFRFPGHEKVKIVDSHTPFGMIPEGWEVKNLQEVSKITFGYNFKSEHFTTSHIGNNLLRIRDILSGESSTYSTENVSDDYKTYQGDLLIGMDGIFHMRIWNTSGQYIVQRVAGIRSTISSLYLMIAIKPQLKNLQETISGSTVGHLANGNIKDFKIIVPKNINLLSQFQDILSETVCLNNVNRKLANMRDLLIPQLISGKREVK